MSVRTLMMLAAGLTLGGCEAVQEVFQDPDSVRGYRLVGAYDASALRSMELLIPEADRPKPYEYLWAPPPSMVVTQQGCGPAKSPDGMGIFEAEAIANRVMPALVLVVERKGDVPPLDTQRVRVAMGEGTPSYFMEPAVQPRSMQIVIEGTSSARYKQQVRTQLATYLCMEHKAGRAWQGGNRDQVRQALLLSPPDNDLPDRKFFGGQSEPVAALLGPPDVCFKRMPDQAFVSRAGGGQGQGSLAIVPSDVWGASLADCPEGVTSESLYGRPREVDITSAYCKENPQICSRPKPMQLALSETPAGAGDATPRRWSELRVKMRGGSDSPTDQFIQVEFAGNELLAGPDGSVHEGVLIHERPMFEPTNDGQLGLIDLVSNIPYRYPTVAEGDDADRYSVLVIPNWQVVEGVRRMAACEGAAAPEAGGTPCMAKPRPDGGAGFQDGVGWLLEHPESLFVMVPSDPGSVSPLPPAPGEAAPEATEWLNIASALSGGDLGLRSWGYTAGMLAGRSPIVLPGITIPSWVQASAAQRAPQHSLILGSIAVLLVLVTGGFVRLRDLWVRVPEERVDFWPGPPVAEEEEGGDDMAELNKAGEGEKK